MSVEQALPPHEDAILNQAGGIVEHLTDKMTFDHRPEESENFSIKGHSNSKTLEHLMY